MTITNVRLKDFRCFREEQAARLAPLTLLVGENSTGKTSFLAMIRILCDVALSLRNPDFKEEPYDLGSFDEIAHHRGARGGRATAFETGFSVKSDRRHEPASNFEFTFGKRGTAPVPIRRRLSRGRAWIDETHAAGEPYLLRVGTVRGRWKMHIPDEIVVPFVMEEDLMLPPYYLFLQEGFRDHREEGIGFLPLGGAPPFSFRDLEPLRRLGGSETWRFAERPFASAPVRSKPRRTYDPARPTPDPEGDYVPMYLAEVFSGDREAWPGLKYGLEFFGRDSGLFDEISIKRLGKRDSEPFQLQVRKYGGGLKGPWRNLIDVGYGVSQALPVMMELLREDAPDLLLIQQPEIHLHPSAQATLGSLFCQVAEAGHQLVVETHSDHLLDRVRMDVRDGKSDLRPEDVSILYFERGDLDVKIHSLRIDEEGNVIGAPEGYRSFFMEETTRSLWKSAASDGD